MVVEEQPGPYGPWHSFSLTLDCTLDMRYGPGEVKLADIPPNFQLESRTVRISGEAFRIVLARQDRERICSLLLARQGGGAAGDLELDAQVTLHERSLACSIACQRKRGRVGAAGSLLFEPFLSLTARSVRDCLRAKEMKLQASVRWRAARAAGRGDAAEEASAEAGRPPYVGMSNQGATCYMNSLLQVWYHLPRLRDMIYGVRTAAHGAFDAAAESAPSSVALALQRVFYRLSCWREPVSTSELTDAFGWQRHEALQQQDVQELARVLCDALELEMERDGAKGALEALFAGKMETYIECLRVAYASRKADSFHDVQLDVRGCRTLEESFQRYVEEEYLTGDNQYDAESHGKQDAKKGTRFLHFPPVLHVHLKRFTFDPQSGRMVKVHDAIAYGDTLDLSAYVAAPSNGAAADAAPRHSSEGPQHSAEGPPAAKEARETPEEGSQAAARTARKSGKAPQTSAEESPHKSAEEAPHKSAEESPHKSAGEAPHTSSDVPKPLYVLHSVIVHQGEVHGGHYYAFIRPSPGAQWHKFNDDVVSTTDASEVLDGHFGRPPQSGAGAPGGRRPRAPSVPEAPKKKTSASAYVLVYIRADAVAEVLSPERSGAAPSALRSFFSAEELHKRRRRQRLRERAEAVSVHVLTEAQCQRADGAAVTRDCFQWKAPLPPPVKVQRENPIAAVFQAVQDDLGVPFWRQRLWSVVRRNNNTVRLQHAIRGRELLWPVEGNNALLHLQRTTDRFVYLEVLPDGSPGSGGGAADGNAVNAGGSGGLSPKNGGTFPKDGENSPKDGGNSPKNGANSPKDGGNSPKIGGNSPKDGAHAAPDAAARLGPMAIERRWTGAEAEAAASLLRSVGAIGALGDAPAESIGAPSANPLLSFFKAYDPFQPRAPLLHLGQRVLRPGAEPAGEQLRAAALGLLGARVSAAREGRLDAWVGLPVEGVELRGEGGLGAWGGLPEGDLALSEMVSCRSVVEVGRGATFEELETHPGDCFVLHRRFSSQDAARCAPRFPLSFEAFARDRLSRRFAHFLPIDEDAAALLLRRGPTGEGGSGSTTGPGLGSTTGPITGSTTAPIPGSTTAPISGSTTAPISGSTTGPSSPAAPRENGGAPSRKRARQDARPTAARDELGGVAIELKTTMQPREIADAVARAIGLSDGDKLCFYSSTPRNGFADVTEPYAGEVDVLQRLRHRGAELPRPGARSGLSPAEMIGDREVKKGLQRIMNPQSPQLSFDTAFFGLMPMGWRLLRDHRPVHLVVVDHRLRSLVYSWRRKNLPGDGPLTDAERARLSVGARPGPGGVYVPPAGAAAENFDCALPVVVGAEATVGDLLDEAARMLGIARVLTPERNPPRRARPPRRASVLDSEDEEDRPPANGGAAGKPSVADPPLSRPADPAADPAPLRSHALRVCALRGHRVQGSEPHGHRLDEAKPVSLYAAGGRAPALTSRAAAHGDGPEEIVDYADGAQYLGLFLEGPRERDLERGSLGPNGLLWLPCQVAFFSSKGGRSRGAALRFHPVPLKLCECDTPQGVLRRVRATLGVDASETAHWRLAVMDSASLRFEHCAAAAEDAEAAGGGDGGGVPDAVWHEFGREPEPQGSALWQQVVAMYPQYGEGDGKFRAMLLNTLPEGSPRFEQCPLLGIDLGDHRGLLDTSRSEKRWSRNNGIRIFKQDG